MNTLKSRFVVAAFASSLAVFAAACSGSQDEVSVKTASAAQTTAPLAVQAQGPARIVAEAFADVPLRPDQRAAVETLVKDADARHVQGHAAGKAFALALADQIERGSIDEAALKPNADAMRTAMEATRADDAAALQKLHDTLDASQREALVSAVKARMKQAFHDRAKDHEGMNPMAQLRTELALTDDQVAQIKTAFHDQWRAHRGDEHAGPRPFDHHARGAKMFEGFVKDDFDAKAALPAPPPDHANAGYEHMVTMAKTVLPILTPEQRTKAAAIVRARAADLVGH
jgi:Spy/CpxP family protein refolding chaperone